MPTPVTPTPPMRDVRDQHLSLLLRCLLREPVGRKELSRLTGISFTTITRLTQALVGSGLVAEVAPPAGPRRRGRPEVPLSLDGPRPMVVIGTHIGATHVRSVASTLTGRVLARQERAHGAQRRHDDAERVIDTAVETTRDIVDRFVAARVLGVGVSAGGFLDFDSGRVVHSPSLDLAGADLRTPLRAALRLPVVVDSSVRTLALHRLWWWPRSTDSLAVVFVAGVISAAIVQQRSLVRGNGATAGTINHLPVGGGPGVRCDCGGIDCAGVVLTSTALQAEATAAGLLPPDSRWSTVHAGTQGDAMAGLRQVRAQRLGATIAHLVELVDPESLILAGAIGTADDVDTCLSAARDRLAVSLPRSRHRLEHWSVTPEVWPSAAAALALDEVLRSPTSYLKSLI